MAHLNAHQLANGEIFKIQQMRWKARTDLTYLCQTVLNYPDVTGPERFPFMHKLQKFPIPKYDEWKNYERLDRGNWVYTPVKPMLDLTGSRRVLILDPRGFLKTTINSMSHSIQWILNYPDIAMTIIQSNGKKSRDILGEIKRHFQANPNFRQLFPDHCPQKKPLDWGNLDEFTTEARSLVSTRKEKTMMTGSIDTGSAGYHFDVMKFSDIVEPNNVKTPEQLESVIKSFYMMENILVAAKYWIDVEGTTYDYSDLYSKIIKGEQKLPKEKRQWNIHVRGCYKVDTSSLPGGEETYSIDEIGKLPFLLDVNGDKISRWPERVTTAELEKKRADDEYIFATQQLNDPSKADETSRAFPVNKEYPKWITQQAFERNVKIVHHTTSVDTAETKTDRADFTAITTVGWDQFGRSYVVEVRHGKWLPDEIIDQIIKVQLRFSPMYLSIEETSYVRGMKDGLLRKIQNLGLHINFKFIKRETTISKKERILNTLQPWYKNGDLRFVEGLGAGEGTSEGKRLTEAVLEELQKFPRYIHDDILDSLSDHFQDREWLGRLAPRNVNPWDEGHSEDTRKKLFSDAYERFLGIDQGPWQRLNTQIGSYNAPVPQDDFYSRTGGL